MSESSNVVSLEAFKKSQALKELAEERAAIQSEEFCQPAPFPEKTMIAGMRKANPADKWWIAFGTICPPGLTDEQQSLLGLWLRHLWLPIQPAYKKVSV
jgi:hypothetical protein